jgi:hypothetical protein
MNQKMRNLLLFTLAMALMMCATPAMAGPFSTAATNANAEVTSIAKIAATSLGVICTVVAGCIVAWKAAHNESFTKELVFGVIGIIVAGVAVAV